MRVNIKRAAWVTGGLFVAGAGVLGFIACSSDTTSTPVTPTAVDSGKADTGVIVGADGAAGDAGAGLDSGKVCDPPFPIRDPGAGPYCPFQLAADGGILSTNCAAAEACCYYQGAPPSPPSFCEVNRTCTFKQSAIEAGAGYNGIAWHCSDKSHCPTGNDCFVVPNPDGGKPVGFVPDVLGCPNLKGSFVFGTRCMPSQTAGSVKLCSTMEGCPTGYTCTPFTTNARQLAYCKAN